MRSTKALCLGSVLLLCCSCSFFSKKVPEINNQQQQASQTLKNGQTLVNDVRGTQQGVNESGRVSYRKENLSLSIKADAALNRYRNNAHALFLCIYQLKDPNAFNQLAEEEGGMPKLLECGRFDSSVANAKRIVVQPGQSLNETRDRAEGARYIGIATGYYGTGKEKTSHLAPLSLKNGDLSGTEVQIDLGPNEIEKVTVR